MNDWIVLVGGLSTPHAVLRECRRAFLALGFARMSYHFVPAFGSQTARSLILAQHGFPQEWLDLYAQEEFRRHDPVPNHIMQAGVTMSWQRAIAEQKLTAGQQDFVEQMRRHGLLHGIGVPLFGAKGKEAYSAFGLDRAIGPADEPLIRRAEAMAQIAHRRTVELVLGQEARTVRLSPRERDVLHWIARGKSNADIATILGISAGTVDTFVRRLFAKLDVSDRVAAIVEGLRGGLVRLKD